MSVHWDMLARGDQVPRFVVTTIDRQPIRYDDLWQRRNLLLVCGADEERRASLRAHLQELTAYETACVLTDEPVEGVPCPGVLIADRWGEIYFISGAVPSVPELVEWLRYVQVQCPECQGETR